MPEFLEYGEEDEEEDNQSDQGSHDTSWKVRKSAIKILNNLLHVKEDTEFAIKITRDNFEKILPLLKHLDDYVNDDLY